MLSDEQREFEADARALGANQKAIEKWRLRGTPAKWQLKFMAAVVERRTRLKLALTKTGISAKAASLKAGLSATYVSDFLHGKSQSNDQALKAICNGLGVRWEWLDADSGTMLQTERADEACTNEIDVPALTEAIEYACKLLGADQQFAEQLARQCLARANIHIDPTRR